MAKQFAQTGYSDFALDRRRHADSSAKRQIDDIGQLESNTLFGHAVCDCDLETHSLCCESTNSERFEMPASAFTFVLGIVLPTRITDETKEPPRSEAPVTPPPGPEFPQPSELPQRATPQPEIPQPDAPPLHPAELPPGVPPLPVRPKPELPSAEPYTPLTPPPEFPKNPHPTPATFEPECRIGQHANPEHATAHHSSCEPAPPYAPELSVGIRVQSGTERAIPHT